jgi:hypothetical protein
MLSRRQFTALLTAAVAMPTWQAHAQPTAGFDHRHNAWDTLLRQHVVTAPGGHASVLRYGAMQAERTRLQAYLVALSAVAPSTYDRWSRAEQLAFLINAYNAFTVELVLTRYPDLKSIKDLGSLLRNPWKRVFFQLLGRQQSLDDVEHGLIRAPGVFDDPRIHFAVVCASIGCPMLRDEAYVAERLDAQLDDGLRRFLGDRARNRFDVATGTLWVSKIFDWYRSDFEKGHKAIGSLQDLFARHADVLGSTPQEQADLKAGRYKLAHLEYDWALNDAR